MAKTKISEFSATANSNTDINSINIAEGCAPSNINDAIRELMAELKDFQAGTKGDSFNGPVGTTTAAAGAFTTLSASSTVSGTGFSTYLASPPAIGGTAPAAGAFTTLSSTGNTTLGDASGDTVTINGTATFANVNPTLSAGTANGVLYLNGSKVATSGSALTFNGTVLYTNGKIGVGETNPTALVEARNTSIARMDADSSAVYFGSGNNYPVSFKVNDSEQMRLTSTGLGIGTSSPSQRLHVTGSSSATTVGTAATIQITSSTGLSAPAGDVYLQAVIDSATPGDRGTALAFFTGRTSGIAERARIDSLGNLGLGVTPSAWSGQTALQTNGGSLATSNTSTLNLTQNAFYNGTSWTRVNALAASMLQQSGGAFNFFTAGSSTAGSAITFTQAMTLDASGNLGIGTTSPTTRLSITDSAGPVVRLVRTSNRFEVAADNDYMELNARDASTYIRFKTADTERARIDSSGNLLVGGTSAIAGERLYVNGSNANYINRIYNSNASPNGVIVSYTGAAPNGTANEFLRCDDTAAARMSVRSNGGIANYQANNVNLSDRREKTNFSPAGEYLSKICAIPVQTFNYIDQAQDDPGLTLGVVAQDVQSVAPELVMESNWGTEENPKMRLSIYQTDLQYALMKSIQELKAELDSVKAELAQLKGA